MISGKNGSHFHIPSDWIYRGEGNSNVVISLPQSKKILRIRKIDKPNSIITWLICWFTELFYWYSGHSWRQEIRDLKFYKKIMRSLLGENYVSDAVQVNLTRSQVNRLQRELSKHRRDFRKTKILQYGRTTIFDDFAYLPDKYTTELSESTFAIEIKPKQGWRPFKERCFPECLFCMNQYLKKERNKIDKISSYCPEDLFSGDTSKMIRAIKGLIETPQNNFKVFRNGVPIYDDEKKVEFSVILREFFQNNVDDTNCLLEEFCHLLQKSLVTNLGEDKSICQKKLFCEWNNKIKENYSVGCVLSKGCVLEKILSVQMLDTEGSHYYYKLLGNEILKDWTYVKKLLKEVDNYPDMCLKCAIMMLSNNKVLDLVYASYLISAVAKDLSLMITFGKVNDFTSLQPVLETKHGKYVVNVGIFDLYPKRLSTVRKHFKRNTDIFEAFLKAKAQPQS